MAKPEPLQVWLEMDIHDLARELEETAVQACLGSLCVLP